MRYGAYGVNYSPISRRKIFRRVFTRFAARFLAQAFFMLISFIFSYSEKFFVVFYLSFYFVLGQGPSARDTMCINSAGDGEDRHHVASPHQRATTSADQADPSPAAKRSWSTRSKHFNQVSSPPFPPACLKTEAPDYTECRAVDCSPVHHDKNNDHECVVPTSNEAATPPANRLKDYTPGAATSHQRPSQLPSLKTKAPDYTECIAVGRSPAHLDESNDHDPFLEKT